MNSQFSHYSRYSLFSLHDHIGQSYRGVQNCKRHIILNKAKCQSVCLFVNLVLLMYLQSTNIICKDSMQSACCHIRPCHWILYLECFPEGCWKKGLFIAKLSFNFNCNLVESWVSIDFIFHTHHPPTRPQEKFKIHLEWDIYTYLQLQLQL